MSDRRDRSFMQVSASDTVLYMSGRDGAPLYVRIASDIRRAIEDGTLEPGEQIPGEIALAAQWNTTRPTVQQALKMLRDEGLIVSRHGVGRFVRQRPPIQVRTSNRYQRRPSMDSTSPMARDAEREGARPAWEWETVRTSAPERIAARLGIEPGAYVMRTTYIYLADELPLQSSTSWEPFDLVGGTDIEEPEGPGRIVGVVARMDSIGVHVDRIVERVRSRPANSEERVALGVPDEVWVQTIERTHWAGDRAVETADIVIPADRYLLEYEIYVPPAEAS